jgi:hypothetical protein
VEGFFVVMVMLGIPTILGWMYRTNLAHQRYMKVLQLKAEMNARLLDKIGNEPGVLDVLKGEGQQKMFEVTLPESGRVPAAYSRMLTAAQAGIVLLSGGAGFLYIRQFMNDHPGDQMGMLVFGTMGVSLGIGTLLSAVAAFVAARAWQNGQEA